MKLFKTIAKYAIKFYLFPFQINHFIFYYVKDNFFTNPSEHLLRTIKLIKKRKTDFKGSVIIDVGCANGSTTLFFAKHFKDLKVYGYEPYLKLFESAKLKCNNYKNIILRNIALGEKEGNAILNVTANSLSSSLNELNDFQINLFPDEHKSKFQLVEKQNVELTTVDKEFDNVKNILLIKIDTQGTELSILKGAIKSLKKTRYVLLEMNNHEIYKDGCQYHQVDEFLRNNSFKLADLVVSFRNQGKVEEYDALYENITS